MTETQATISEWAFATFGKPTPLRAAVRTNAELAELLTALCLGNKEQIAKELADVAICLYACATLLEIEILEPDDYHRSPFPWHGVLTEMARIIDAVGNGYCFGNRTEQRIGVRRTSQALHDLAHEHGADLLVEIDRKMAINRARTWKLDGSGCGQHVEPSNRPRTSAPPTLANRASSADLTRTTGGDS
jgi:NTP pyrophosphatase (non-canonical NTP hydrolase)